MGLPTPYYDDGHGRVIYHADCREILSLLEPGSVDLVLTDPPYGHRQNDGDLASKYEAALGLGESGPPRPIANDGPEANDLVRLLFTEAKRLLKPGGCCCCCCCGGGGPDPQFARWSLWMDELLGFKQAIVWDKVMLGLGWHYRRCYEFILVGQKRGAACTWNGGHSVPNVIRLNEGYTTPRAHEHPTQKPVALMAKFVGWHANPGDLVLDPFMGGGPVGPAAKSHRCRYIGIEIEERYCEMAVQRLSQEVFEWPEPVAMVSQG